MLVLSVKEHVPYFKAVCKKELKRLFHKMFFTDEDRSNTVIVVAVVLVVFVLILATALLYLYRKGR
jgi:hypothetical protein